jgi:repressor of nif and glnA expression
MDTHGLGGILAIGAPNRPLLDVNVAEGKAGMIVMGGMNPLAAMYESGVPMEIHSLSCLEDISRFAPFPDIARRGRRISPYID